MSFRSRLARITLVLATSAGLAASTGTASADPSANGLSHRSDNTPGGATTQVDGHGRKVG